MKSFNMNSTFYNDLLYPGLGLTQLWKNWGGVTSFFCFFPFFIQQSSWQKSSHKV